MKRGTMNNVIALAGSVAISCAGVAILDKIEKMEETKFTKTLYKVGTWCGIVASAGMVGNILLTGDLADEMFAGKFKVVVRTITENVEEKQEEEEA